MFEFIRKYSKVVGLIFFPLIIVAFVISMVGDYDRFRDTGETVARVGSVDISRAEWDAAHKDQIDQRRRANPKLDIKVLDTPQERYATLEKLVRDRVLAQAVDALKLGTSDTRLANALQQDPTIGALRKPDGKLDVEGYRQYAASLGLTPEGLEATVRRNIALRQVEVGVAATGFTPKAVADVSLNAYFEKREVQLAAFAANDFTAKVNPTDADIAAHFKAHQADYKTPEQASIEYLVLDLNALKKDVTLSEADMKTYYEQNAKLLSGGEERRASHILIAVAKDAPAAEQARAKAKAQELLQAIRSNPASFADLAKKNSQDELSAPGGGDLGYQKADGLGAKALSDAIFSMKVNDVSDLVVSDFGYHIVKLVDIKGAKSYEELRPRIESELMAQMAKKKYAEVAEAFTNGVYEQADNLKAVADKLKLEVKTAEHLTHTPAAGSTGVLANPKLLAAIFSSESIEKKQNTSAIEVGPNQLASARILKYTPTQPQTLDQVRELVKARVVATQAAELAKKEGLAKLAAWKAAPASAVLQAAAVVSREDAANLDPKLVDAALNADPAHLPAFQGVDLAAKGYAILRVNKTLPRAATDEARAKQEHEQYTQGWTAAEAMAYYELLKQKFKVQILVPKPTVVDQKSAADSATAAANS